MEKVALDVGFGWTKVATGQGTFKFPTWLAYKSDEAINNLDSVSYDGKEYVVGTDAKYERQKITIAGIDELINYFPVFVKFATQKAGLSNPKIITGLPPTYRDKFSILEKQGITVLPQGLGIYLDTIDMVDADELLVIDIGFNTVDYILVIDGERKRGNTLVKQGVERMVEIFKSKLPAELSYLKQFNLQRLMDTFEKGYANVEGERVDLSDFKQQAIDEYNEVVRTRLRSEIGNLLEEVEQVVVAGGGAYYLNKIRASRVFIPHDPEFSQARGYLKFISEENE